MKFFSGILPIAGVALTLFLGATAQKATDVIRSIDFVASSAHNLDEDIQRVNDGNVADEGRVRSWRTVALSVQNVELTVCSGVSCHTHAAHRPGHQRIQGNHPGSTRKRL